MVYIVFMEMNQYSGETTQYPRFYTGIIVDVDPENRTYSFIAIPGNFPYLENISYSSTSPDGFGGDGHPYRMQPVLIMMKSPVDAVHIRYLTNRRTEYNDDGFPSDRKKQAGGVPSFDPMALPGDFSIVDKDGARVGILRGGVALFGASDMCQTLYFSEENLRRTIVQNSESFSDAGRGQVFNDDGDVTSRTVVADEDLQTYKAAQIASKDNKDDTEYPSYFPLQVDVGKLGDFITAFVGEIVDDKRQNRAVLNVKKTGVISLDMGDNLHDGIKRISVYLDPAGSVQLILRDVSGEKEIYRKEIIASDERVTEREVIAGNKYLAVKKGSFRQIIDHKFETVAKIFYSIRSLVVQRVSYAIDDASTQKTTKLKNEVFPGKIID